MRIGVPTEVKSGERRVGLTPDKVDVLVRAGHKVAIQQDAGIYASCPDEDYIAAGASIIATADDLWASSDMVVKVKEPQPEEYGRFREGLILFTYLHLAPEAELTRALCESKVAGVAYETVQEPDGTLPLLTPMSEIAGRLSPQIAARLLQSDFDGPGRLLGGVPGAESCRMVVVGGGNVGLAAALIGTALGARVIVFDLNLERLRYIEHISRNMIKTMMSTPLKLTEFLARADVAVGAVLIPGARAPRVITKEMLGGMKPNSLVMDVAIDQGGSVEGIRPTTQSEPTYREGGVTHFAVTNIPGTVATTASVALSNATYRYVLKLANDGIEKTVSEAGSLSKGLNTLGGHVTHPAVADSLALPYVPVAEAL
jgi:alanine dehydrogenase